MELSNANMKASIKCFDMHFIDHFEKHCIFLYNSDQERGNYAKTFHKFSIETSQYVKIPYLTNICRIWSISNCLQLFLINLKSFEANNKP